jgi:anti-anti-sigma factor
VAKNELDIIVARDGQVDIALIDGPVDSATIDVFKDKLDSVCAHSGAKVLLDCQRLTYLNSRAIGLLVKYHRSLLLTHGRFALCNLNSRLVRTLDLLQLGKALFVYESREKALEVM